MTARNGISSKNRELVERLHREARGPFDVRRAAGLLALEHDTTRRFLAYLSARGWLARVRRGLYALVPLGAAAPSDWREDPWLVAAHSYAPCYVGGWTALEHWGLTEQIFRDVVVMTARRVRHTKLVIQGTPFRLRHLSKDLQFGTRKIWRGNAPVLLSDPSRTIVDILDEPSLGGGIRHTAQCLAAYFAGEHRNDAALLEYAKRVGNGAVFKRLGFLLEELDVGAPEVVAEALGSKTSGLSRLDPSVPANGRVTKRWNLRVNVAIAPDQ